MRKFKIIQLFQFLFLSRLYNNATGQLRSQLSTSVPKESKKVEDMTDHHKTWIQTWLPTNDGTSSSHQIVSHLKKHVRHCINGIIDDSMSNVSNHTKKFHRDPKDVTKWHDLIRMNSYVIVGLLIYTSISFSYWTYIILPSSYHHHTMIHIGHFLLSIFPLTHHVRRAIITRNQINHPFNHTNFYGKQQKYSSST